MTDEALLRIDGLVTEFQTHSGVVTAVAGASYHVNRGETLGVVGESGSGKSVAVASILGLLPAASSRIRSGTAMFDGRDLLAMSESELRRVRGAEIGLIFQDPMTAFNPVMTVGAQIAESLREHGDYSRRAAKARVAELLAEVGIPDPARRANQYPHEFSGGMRQRAMIAMAIANRPALIIADEPTTALDVTVQAQILDLLQSIQQEHNAAMIMITHDFGVIAEVAERVVVMYSGRVVESADVDTAFHGPRHPYTSGLLHSLPVVNQRVENLPTIGGQPPNPLHMPTGCSFAPRCDRSDGRVECNEEPSLAEVSVGHRVACHFQEEAVMIEAGS